LKTVLRKNECMIVTLFYKDTILKNNLRRSVAKVDLFKSLRNTEAVAGQVSITMFNISNAIHTELNYRIYNTFQNVYLG